MLKTEKEVKDQIELAKKLKLVMPRRNFFGEDNHEKIDNAVEALEKCLKLKLNQYDIEDELDELECGLEPDEACEHEGLRAYRWVLGQEEDPPYCQRDLETFSKTKK